jgi:fibrillarin-like pre-rRNA processing protein
MNNIFPAVWKKDNMIFTENLIPGDRSYTKNLIKESGREFREWNPNKSKPCAAIVHGLKLFPLAPKMKVLYLGASFGQTVTFFSDIVGKEGMVYAVEFSERCMRDLNDNAEKRGNIVPILGDARKPEDYSWIEPVDIVYEDVASDDQSEIMIRNCRQFLKKDGFAMIAIKARSINVVKDPNQVYREQIAKLEKHFKILEKVELDPYEQDHMFIVMKLKPE